MALELKGERGHLDEKHITDGDEITRYFPQSWRKFESCEEAAMYYKMRGIDVFLETGNYPSDVKRIWQSTHREYVLEQDMGNRERFIIP